VKNNFSTILNVVLIIAVGVLFYLHFSSAKAGAAGKKDSKNDTAPQLSFKIPKNLAGAKVLYINIDSINAKYEALVDLQKEEGGTFEQQYQQYQNRAAIYQRRHDQLYGGAWPFSADSAEKEEKYLAKEEAALTSLQTYLGNLQNKAMEKNAIINDKVALYFKQYSKEKGIDFILATGSGSPIVYANDSLDITNDVIEALNVNYRISKGKNVPGIK